MTKEIQTFAHYSLATIVSPGSQIATAQITIDIQTVNNQKNQATNLILADALLSGAGTLSRDAFLHEVNKLGASIDIEVGQGFATISLRATESVFPKLLKLFEIMVTKPNFSASELKRIKTTAKNALHQAREDSKAAASDNLRNIFYGNEDRHYSYSIDDLVKAVDTLTPSDLKRTHQLLLSRMWYASVGGSKDTVKNFTQTLARLRKNVPSMNGFSTHQLMESVPKVVLESIPSRQNIDFSIGVPVPLEVRNEEYVPLSFGIAVLGKWGGFAGRLMSTVREKEGLTYGIYGRLEGIYGSEKGYFRIMTFFAPEKAKHALHSTFREIRNIYEKGITDAEFKKFKTILATQQVLLNDSLARQLSDLHVYHQAGFTLDEMEAHKQKIETLSKKAVNDALKKYLNPAMMSISGAGPTKQVQKDIEAFFKTLR